MFQFSDFNGHKYGTHVSKNGNISNTIKKVLSMPSVTFQMYICNPRSKNMIKYDIDDLILSQNLLNMYDIYGYIHGCLLYNLAGTTKGKEDIKYEASLESTIKNLSIELDVQSFCGFKGVVVHIGSCKNKDEGIDTIVETIIKTLKYESYLTTTLIQKTNITKKELKNGRKILLENGSGGGNKIGNTLDDLSKIFNKLPKKYRKNIGFCIDTAHLYGAGIYNFGNINDISHFYNSFDDLIGLEYLELFHLNDSRKSTEKGKNAYYGSNKDRHENIGIGYIFSNSKNDSYYIPQSITDKINSIDNDNINKDDGLILFFEKAHTYDISIIGETPSINGDGEESGYGCDLVYVMSKLKDTKHPIEIIYK